MHDRQMNHLSGLDTCRAPSAVDAAFAVPFRYRLRFTKDVFDPGNRTLVDAFDAGQVSPSKVVALIDAGVVDSWPDLASSVETYCRFHSDIADLVCQPVPVAGGEAAKLTPAVVEQTQRLINDNGICRQSYVMAIGGGAMLDAVGYGAATSHRGVRLIRIPTTTLAQGDAAIGVKNGINAFGKKNYLGTFAVPWAVINDSQFLATLGERDWRCGLSEAVKVALVKDADYFGQIERSAERLRERDEDAIEPILAQCAELHLRHITEGGDPFELTTARPLDFGHWAAHRLEQMTNFELRHGEAVAIGLAIDVTYAAKIGLLQQDDARRILALLVMLGFGLPHPALQDIGGLLQGLEEFREHLGGRLTIALIDAIGHQVDVHEVDREVMSKAIRNVMSCEV